MPRPPPVTIATLPPSSNDSRRPTSSVPRPRPGSLGSADNTRAQPVHSINGRSTESTGASSCSHEDDPVGMTEDEGRTGRNTAGSAAAALGAIGRTGGRALTNALGGAERTRVVLMLAAVLALSSADASTVGASATHLRSSLHISNTDIGLLVSV